MAVITQEFEHIAAIVTERASEVLGAPVWVVSESGMVVASSAGSEAASQLPPFDVDPADSLLRVPLRGGSQAGEVIVAETRAGETVSSRLGSALVELMISQALILAQLPNREELKSRFIHDLLRGRIDNEADIMREGELLGMNLAVPRAVILIDASDYVLATEDIGYESGMRAHQIPRRAQCVIASIVEFFALPSDTICAYIGDGEIAVLKAAANQDLVAWTDAIEVEGHPSGSWANLTALKRAAAALLKRLHHDTRSSVTIGVGRYHPGIRGMAHSYRDARAAISLGSRFHGQNLVHCLDGLGVAAFVGISDERTKLDLAMHLLSPLDQEPELIETLHTFFKADCCPSSTAHALCIHRNTLSYRLDKIAMLTGLDPRRFDDAVQFRLALLVRALRSRPD